MRAQKAALDKLQADLSKVVADGTADEATAAEIIGRVEAAKSELGRTRAVMLYRMRRSSPPINTSSFRCSSTSANANDTAAASRGADRFRQVTDP